jgi:hypothetical protein
MSLQLSAKRTLLAFAIFALHHEKGVGGDGKTFGGEEIWLVVADS